LPKIKNAWHVRGVMGKSGMEIKHIKELDIMACIVLWNV
jgi:hypothetical protein